MKRSIIPILFLSSSFLLSCSTGTKTEESSSHDSPVIDRYPDTTSWPAPARVPEDTTRFGQFISLFYTKESSIPDWAVEEFLQVSPESPFSTQELLESDPVYVVLYTAFMMVGPGMYVLHAATFSKDGVLIMDLKLGSSYPDAGPGGGGSDYTYYFDTENHLLSITNTSTEWDEDTNEESTTESINYYVLDKIGNLINARKYPEASTDYLEAGDLSAYSKEELKLMRNEIFAIHGYIFKTQSLKDYFSSQPWYSASYDNVDDLLSEVEKHNVQVIKQVEDSK